MAGRVLTLAGPGGCGKTRLAIRVCQMAAEAWRDGAFWVGLEEETDGTHVARRMAAALDVLLPAGPDPVPALVSALRDRELLVVVDNCEHVLDDAARVIAAVLSTCPRVAVLATSRSTLGIAGERVWRVPPMGLADALDLFLERVRADAAGGAEARSDLGAAPRPFLRVAVTSEELRARLQESALHEAVEHGRVMNLPAAVAYATRAPPAPSAGVRMGKPHPGRAIRRGPRRLGAVQP